jgi:hypothetical protein
MGSRYIKDLVLNIDPNYVENEIQTYLRGNSYNLANEKGETYYKSGGIMMGLRGFKYSYQNGILHIEAWCGKIGKELNIGDGKFVGSAAKIPYYNSILALQGALDKASQPYQQPYGQMQQPVYTQPYGQMQQPVYTQPYGQMQQPVYTQPYGQMQQPVYSQQNAQMQQPVYTQTSGSYSQTGSPVANEINKANDRNAAIAFWLSIGSLVLMFGSRFSLLINVFSFTLAIKYGLVSRKKGLAIASIVINSVVIAITAILIFASF